MSRAGRWERDRFDYDDDVATMRGGRGSDLPDKYDRRYAPRAYDDDMIRDRRYYDDEPRTMPRREYAPEYERRGPPVLERERDYYRDASPPRPSFLRRQSSLDSYDRKPLHRFYEKEEYPVPARREDIYRQDYRAPPYAEIPLPKTRRRRELPPPREYDDRYYEDIKVAEPDYYGDEHYRPYPDRIREREYVRRHDDDDRDGRNDRHSSPARSHSTRTRSRSTRARSKKSKSSASSASTATTRSSSASSSSSGGTAIQEEYPKKGKTRIPARLVSKRAIIDIGYPFTEEVSQVYQPTPQTSKH